MPKKINATTQTSQKKPKKAFLGTFLKILTMTKKLRFFGARSATASQNKFYWRQRRRRKILRLVRQNGFRKGIPNVVNVGLFVEHLAARNEGGGGGG